MSTKIGAAKSEMNYTHSKNSKTDLIYDTHIEKVFVTIYAESVQVSCGGGRLSYECNVYMMFGRMVAFILMVSITFIFLSLIFLFISHSPSFSQMVEYLNVCFICNRCDL